VTLTLTVICFVIAALLLRFSDFDKSVTSKQISLLSYFFHRYSKADTYSIVDLIKTVFLFFVSLFSVGLSRLPRTNIGPKELRFRNLFGVIKFNDILLLSIVFVVSSLVDFGLFKIDNFSTLNTKNVKAAIYIQDLCFHFRIYIPLILFALTIRNLTSNRQYKLTLKRILFLYISLWLYNEFAYEISLWLRIHVFNLILMPFDSQNFYLFESFLGIPLIAFYFLGYYSAMTASLRLTEST
jgi:hypothetical protein